MISRKPLSKAELEEIQDRWNLTSPGPWYAYLEKSVMSATDESVVAHCPDIAQQPSNWNSEFIAHAKQDIPRLLEEVEEFRSALEGLLEVIREDAKNAMLDIDSTTDSRVRKALSLLAND